MAVIELKIRVKPSNKYVFLKTLFVLREKSCCLVITFSYNGIVFTSKFSFDNVHDCIFNNEYYQLLNY